MSEAQILLTNLRTNGVRVSIVGSDLKIKPPANQRFSTEIVVEIKKHKAEIISLLGDNDIEPYDWRDYCSCGAKLYTERNQWFCPKNCK